MSADEANSSHYLTITETAKVLGLHRKTVETLVHRGELAAYNFGSATRPHYRIHRADLDAFLERRRVTV